MLRYTPLLLIALLSACATSPEGRQQLATPAPLHGFSAVYSEVDMRLQLVVAREAPECEELACFANAAFDQRVLEIGERLAKAAFGAYPELAERIPRFEFIVADKVEPGSASSSAGTVMIFRGVQNLELDDVTLSFLIAREMGHVIGGHHDENFATGVFITIAAQILVPALNIARGAVALVSGNAAAGSAVATSSVATSAVASAASFAGSRALRAAYRPQQMREAEKLGLRLLADTGVCGREVSDHLQAWRGTDASDWSQGFRDSAQRVAALMQGPDPAPERATVAAASQTEPAISERPTNAPF